ncbi:extracellular solute-binding protein [Nonomuraea sp. N2-4H]
MRKGRAAAILAGLAVAVAACGNAPTTTEPTASESASASDGGAKPLQGVKLEVAAKWTGAEQKNFEQVLKAFSDKTGAEVTYASTGEDTGAYLGPRIQGGSPPDVAILPQPGLVQQYAEQGALKPLTDDVIKEIDANYTPYWKELGSVDGKVYGVLVKAAHKSLVWYRSQAFEDAGVQPPTNWDEMVKAAQTLADSGTPPFSFCGASGWTLTDLFENVYLSTAGRRTTTSSPSTRSRGPTTPSRPPWRRSSRSSPRASSWSTAPPAPCRPTSPPASARCTAPTRPPWSSRPTSWPSRPTSRAPRSARRRSTSRSPRPVTPPRSCSAATSPWR